MKLQQVSKNIYYVSDIAEDAYEVRVSIRGSKVGKMTGDKCMKYYDQIEVFLREKGIIK